MRPLTLTLRHFAEADVPVRCALLREPEYQANVNDLAMVADDDALADKERRTIREEQATRRMFSVCGADGTVLGFVWLAPIDWLNQTCELSIALLPEYRLGLGTAAVAAIREYLHAELNLQIVVNQVLSHNTSLQSADRLATRSEVLCPHDSYTVGQWRTACYWTNSEAQARSEYEGARRARRERIRALAGGGSP